MNALPSWEFALCHQLLCVTPFLKFAIVKGQFINETDSLTASRKLMKSHFTKHV